jgi:hypothetical protein
MSLYPHHVQEGEYHIVLLRSIKGSAQGKKGEVTEGKERVRHQAD